MEPDDNYAYDPLAEAIGWLVRECAGLETWLNVAVSTLLELDYAKVERIHSREKVEKLTLAAPELHSVGLRVLGVFDVRHGIVHGIGALSADGQQLRTELVDRKDPAGGPKFRTHTRHQLLGFTNVATALSGEIQSWMIERLNGPDRDIEDGEVDEPVALSSRPLSSPWVTDGDVLALFPTVTPGRVYSMHQGPDGGWWGVLFDVLTGKPRKVRRLPDLP